MHNLSWHRHLWHVLMLSSELKARSQKLVKEQAEQAERTRRRAEAERIAKQRQQRRIAEAEEQARVQRLAALQRAEQATSPPLHPFPHVMEKSFRYCTVASAHPPGRHCLIPLQCDGPCAAAGSIRCKAAHRTSASSDAPLFPVYQRR